MAQLVALYKKPEDAAAFDGHYHGTHLPLAKTLPGLRSYVVSNGPVAVGAGESPYHLVATLGFDSMAALQEALASPEGRATADDLAHFAQAGVELLMFETKQV
ncbi:MAG: EthD family reductase [Chitinophagaceae bacterium]|nr:EthD family reductase [Rubrivivax sp.]